VTENEVLTNPTPIPFFYLPKTSYHNIGIAVFVRAIVKPEKYASRYAMTLTFLGEIDVNSGTCQSFTHNRKRRLFDVM